MSENKRIVFIGPGRVTKFLQVDNRGMLSDLKLAFAHYGLTYFEDAEEDPMPKMFVSLTWDDVKTRILSAVRDFVKLV